MTTGFKVLLNDLRQLMNDIKDSGATLRRSNSTVERNTSTVEINSRGDNDREKSDLELQRCRNGDSRSLNAKVDISATASAVTETFDLPLSNSHYQENKNRLKNIKKPNPTKVRAPLRSSSPKRSNSDLLDSAKVDVGYEYSVSDISVVEPDLTEGQSYLPKGRYV